MSARHAGPPAYPVAALARALLAAVPLSTSLAPPLARPLAAQTAPSPAALAPARQLILVTADGWDTTTGTLRRYVRSAAGRPWVAEGDALPVVLGRTGMAWGVGQGGAPAGAPVKREGDGRSPAGAYALLHAFGDGVGDGSAMAAPRRRPHPGHSRGCR